MHHRSIVRALADRFDTVIIVPCGPRPDKAQTADLPAVHRSAMVRIAFLDLEGVEIDLFDLDQQTFTRTFDLQARYEDRGEVWLIIGTDLILGGGGGRSPLQHQWYRGQELWRNSRFVVLPRRGVDFDAADLPPHSELIEGEFEGASSEIRHRASTGEDIRSLVTPEVARYIEEHGLYTAGG